MLMEMINICHVKGGTSHLRWHADSCHGSSSVAATPQLTNFFKASSVPASVKKTITAKCAAFVCKDIRSFETVAGDGLIALAQSLINIGAKCGQVSANDILPHPTTVSWCVTDLASNLKDDVVKPELCVSLNKWGGSITTDMWTECYMQTSYITITAHYITNEWMLRERVLATREFDPALRHTAVNIKQAVSAVLDEFGIDVDKVVFVTDRGANVLAAMKDYKHISCSDHMINTVLTHLFEAKGLEDCPTIRSLLTASKELVRYF